jgi:hypothetical protein
MYKWNLIFCWGKKPNLSELLLNVCPDPTETNWMILVIQSYGKCKGSFSPLVVV